METIRQRLLQLIENNDWSVEDHNWYLDYLDKNDTAELQQIMQEYFSSNIDNGVIKDDHSAKKTLELIHQKIQASKPATVIRFSIWKQVAAAAAILILIGAGAFFLFNKGQKQIAKTNNTDLHKNDVVPGGNKAVLTLGDNSQIILDNAQNGILTQQGNTKVSKLDDGQIAYNSLNEKQTQVVYNMITTPRGGQYQLTLSDGSKVWLNAASSIRFPASFIGDERKVEITGEAYFEVAKNASMPFKVNVAGKEEVEVLGTHFNINSYTDEATINTTLLEGSVKVLRVNGESSILKPGEQSQLNTNGQIVINKNADLGEIMAWRNGQFIFNSANIEYIMRQVSRWYDVDVIYNRKISRETYSGIVSRNGNVSQVLKIMEQGGVKFTIDGKKITVLE